VKHRGGKRIRGARVGWGGLVQIEEFIAADHAANDR